jgi:hypothetical protein
LNMFVLVDYDNVDRLERRRGVTQVVMKLVSNISGAELSQTPRVHVRLYGGWYEGNARTRQASDLLAEVGNSFQRRSCRLPADCPHPR